MKVNILEAHDRFKELSKQNDIISQGCEDCIKNRPQEFGDLPFYIFAHKRELDVDERVNIFNEDVKASCINKFYMRKYLRIDTVPTHRLIWSARLTKPLAQENSMLFKAYPPGDNIKIIWIIPQKEYFEQYNKDDIAEDNFVKECIFNFLNRKDRLEYKEDDDLSDDIVSNIYLEMSRNARMKSDAKNGFKQDYDWTEKVTLI